jgi:hypothetical protein
VPRAAVARLRASRAAVSDDGDAEALTSCRYTFPLNARNLERLSGGVREFWQGVSSAFQ